MKRIFVFGAVVVLALAMGMGGAVADEEATGPDPDNLTDEDVHDLLEDDPGEVSDETRQAVASWATANAGDLNGDELEELHVWTSGGDRADQGDNATGLEGAENVTCERTVDAETCVTEWSYADGMFTITFWSEDEERVGLTEASDWDEDAERFAYAEEDLEPGETTVTFTVYERQGAGVGIMSETARGDQQGGAIISTGQHAEDPFRHFGGTSGLFSGVFITVMLAVAGAGIVVWQEESGVVKA